jgi:hypothetical protein
MPVAAKITALLSEAMSMQELDAMTPAQRQRFAALCHHWWQLAEQKKAQPKSGVLAALRAGAPRHE